MALVSFKIWLRAIRPHTLPASVSPVVVGACIAYSHLFARSIESDFSVLSAIACVLFALFCQIASNLANDYFDYHAGIDRKEKTEKERVLLQGLIPPRKMLYAAIFFLAMGCLCGLYTLFVSGWAVLWVGILVSVAVFAYTAGPYPLAHHGWSEWCVIIFYGFIAVGGTFYVLTQQYSWKAFLLGFAMGLATNAIMMVNNYRDRELDRQAGKRTLANSMSANSFLRLYLLQGIAVVACCVPFVFIEQKWTYMLTIVYLWGYVILWRKMKRVQDKKLLNPILAKVSLLCLLLAAAVAMAVLS